MNTLDTKGLLCPKPLILLKEALTGLEAGEELRVETDNDTSLKNLLSYLKDQGVEPQVVAREGARIFREFGFEPRPESSSGEGWR